MDQQLPGSVSAREEEVLACALFNFSITQTIEWKKLKLDDIYPCMLCDKTLKPHDELTVHADLDEK